MAHGRVYSWTQCGRDNSNDPGSRTRAMNTHTASIKKQAPPSCSFISYCQKLLLSERSLHRLRGFGLPPLPHLLILIHCFPITLSFFVLTDRYSSLRLVCSSYLRLLASLILHNRYRETTCFCASTRRRSEYTLAVLTRCNVLTIVQIALRPNRSPPYRQDHSSLRQIVAGRQHRPLSQNGPLSELAGWPRLHHP